MSLCKSPDRSGSGILIACRGSAEMKGSLHYEEGNGLPSYCRIRTEVNLSRAPQWVS